MVKKLERERETETEKGERCGSLQIKLLLPETKEQRYSSFLYHGELEEDRGEEKVGTEGEIAKEGKENKNPIQAIAS